MKEGESVKCPYCSGELEVVCLLGNIQHVTLTEYGLQWFEGKPTWTKNLMKLGEPIGEFGIGKGSYALGNRCRKCRKIILDY